MGTWSISPTDGGASIDENGVANIPKNEDPEEFEVYTITYEDEDGCKTSIQYEVPPCDIQCGCSDIESRIVYTNAYLPLPSRTQRNVMLFSANTQGCGSISAFCSSEYSSIFDSDGDNLVRVEEIEKNKKYAVYANIKPYTDSGNRRTCTVNIYIALRDGTSCSEIVKTFVQDKSVNCKELLKKKHWSSDVVHYFSSKTFGIGSGGERTNLGYTYDGDESNSRMFFLLEGDCPSWISYGLIDSLSYKYLGDDNKWTVLGYLESNNGIDDREFNFAQVGYILDDDKSIIPGVEYSAKTLRKMAGTQCGQHSNSMTITQWGCNCNHAWTGDTAVTIDYTAGYTDVDIDSRLNGCARLTAVESIDECDWLTCNIVGTGTVSKLRLIATENETASYRSCNINVYITDSSGNDPCTKKFLVQQRYHELDCTNCDSIKALGFDCDSYWHIPAAGGTTAWPQFSYPKSIIQSPCNGSVTYEISTVGIEHPCVNPRLDHTGGRSYVELYFTADPNTDSVEKSFNLIIKYSNSSISNCTSQCIVYQDAVSAPSCVIPTQVSKGTVPVTGDKADKIRFKISDGGGYNYTGLDITIGGSAKDVTYSNIIGKTITGVTVTTNNNEVIDGTISPATVECTTSKISITLTGSATCSESSYEFELNYTEGGRTDTTPITVKSGSRKKIGELKNSISSLYAECCKIEMKTTHTSVFGDFEVVAKSGGGYELYATAKTGLSASQVAPINVTWYYTDSGGNIHYPPTVGNTGTIYLNNDPDA
jgi:hypothetical protein